MRKLLLLSLALVLLAGCKKTAGGGKTNPPSTSGTGGTTAHAPTGVVLNPGLGGGGGAAQAVRKAVGRIVPDNDLHNIQIFINTALAETGKMPTAQELTATLQREAPKIYKQVQDKSITLTGTQSKDGIWAYTTDPQTIAGEHLVLLSSGRVRMDAQTLEQQLK